MPTTTQKKTAPREDFRARRAAIYSQVIREMRERSPKEVFQTLVKAGIYRKDGRLTAHYRAD